MEVTYDAVVELKKMFNVENNPVTGVRINVLAGCCSPKLKVSYAEKIADGEKQESVNGVALFFDKQTEEMLSGYTIDYNNVNGFKLDFMRSNRGCCR